MRRLLKAIGKLVFGRYRLARIYGLELRSFHFAPYPEYDLRRITRSDVERCSDPKLNERGSYGGENAYGFGLWYQGELASTCWFWNHYRFQDPKLWEIRPHEAIMVDLMTADAYRGHGLAPILTEFAADQLKRDGFERLVSWVWHSNYPSIRAFEKAGWSYIAFVANLPIFHSKRSIRLAWHVKSRAGRGEDHPAQKR